MIVPMKKVSFVFLNDAKKDSLLKLRKIGVVHLEQIEGCGDTLSDLKKTYSNLEKALMTLSEIKLDKKQAKALKQIEISKSDSIEKAQNVIEMTEKIKGYENNISLLNKEIDRLAAWKGFNPKDFEYLASKGIYLLPYECSKDFYNKKFPESVNRIYVNGDKSTVRFLVISEDGSKPQDLPSEVTPVLMSALSTEEMKKQILADKSSIDVCKAEIVTNVVYIDSIKNTMALCDKDIEFENAYTGIYTDAEGENKAKLAWFTGFVPEDDLDKVKVAAKQNQWGFLAEEPDNPDEVPTKLKNNKFASLIYPVTGFLGTVPGYAEYDISGWFLIFFAIFFGMIFGDAGYGLLIILVGLFMIFKGLAKNKRVSSASVLLLLLGVTTAIWGTLTCNWFGIKPEALPQEIRPFLEKISWNWISNASTLNSDVVSENLQIFCFTLALIQLSVAHIKAMAKHIKTCKFLGDFGSLLMLFGMFYLVMNMVVSGARFPFGLDLAQLPKAFGIPIELADCGVKCSMIALPLIGCGFVLNFIFSNYEGSVGKSILESCKNIISVLLGVVNVFSDIVSYIRLWAVGLAGAAIANTVNEMAGPMLGGFIIFAGIILLVVGHGLNLILNVLSVIVHGVRLNTLEFSNHLGMTWSGFSYKPFAEK